MVAIENVKVGLKTDNSGFFFFAGIPLKNYGSHALEFKANVALLYLGNNETHLSGPQN